jgi:5-methylcytosine-specific restriction protein A
MPKRMLRICARPGCNALSENRYCPIHAPAAEAEHKARRREAFDRLTDKRTLEQHAFYQSEAWHEASRRHRRAEPLCRRCHSRGIIRQAEMVHHDPDLSQLMARGLNPLDDMYLVSLCNRCHLEDLRKKKE